MIHLAAQVSVPYSLQQPEENHAVNVGGTSALIEAAKKHGISRFITASSAAVYGSADSFPLDEDKAGDFHSPYAESKWMNEEQIVSARKQGMEALALRLFNVYGPGQRADGTYAAVIPKFIEQITQEGQPIILGDGLQTRDFIHVDDVANALLMFSTLSGKNSFIMCTISLLRLNVPYWNWFKLFKKSHRSSTGFTNPRTLTQTGALGGYSAFCCKHSTHSKRHSMGT